MGYIITKTSLTNSKSSNEEGINIYQSIMKQYKSDDLIFKIIKNDGTLKLLTKKECIHQTRILSETIIKFTKGIIKKDQLKIFGVINASEESVFLMLSSLLLGAHHSICFEDLCDESIIERLKIFQPDIILCRQHLLSQLSIIVKKFSKKELTVLPIDLRNKKINFDENNIKERSYYHNESNLFTLFTSGSTGTPKAVTHSAKNYIKYTKFTTKYFFGIKKGSVVFTATDAGWINGHTYAFYGPLTLGAISVINENPLFVSLPRQLSEILDAVRPDILYTSVTVLRLIKSVVKADETINSYCRSNLNLDRIGSCGEPLANSVGEWATKFFKPKRKAIVNTYFQTETGGILVAPRDEDIAPNDYSCVGKPRKELGLNIAKEIMTEEEILNEGLDPNEILVCNKWDGIFQYVISNKKSNYFTKKGYFRTHDVGFLDNQGYLYIGGRSDDVINVAGHRISSSEIESVSIEVENIDETCAVELKDNIYGSKPILYVSTSIDDEKKLAEIFTNIRNRIKKRLSKYHIPDRIEKFKYLPKTKSGKIIRSIMRLITESSLNIDKINNSNIANRSDFLISFNEFKNKGDKKYKILS